MATLLQTLRVLFTDPEMDPKSDASPKLQYNCNDFIAKTKTLETAACEADTAFLQQMSMSPQCVRQMVTVNYVAPTTGNSTGLF